MLADVHANFAALDAVLTDVAHRAVEGIVHLGDLVGNGAEPNQVVDRLRREEALGVAGDWDLAICHDDEHEGLRNFLPPALPSAIQASYRMTRSALTAENRQALVQLPAQLRIEEGGVSCLFVHASPERPDEALTDEVADERLLEFFAAAEAQVLLVGHTHVGTVREVVTKTREGSLLLLNPGSVGMPRDGDPRASYLILDTEEGLRVEHVRVPIDG